MMNYSCDYGQSETEIYFDKKIIDKFSIENESDLDDEYNPFAYLE